VTQAIRELRRAQGLSQAELSEQAGLATDTVGRLERATFSPSLNTLFSLADGFGLSLVTVLQAAELVEREGAGELLEAVAGLGSRAMEDAIAQLWGGSNE